MSKTILSRFTLVAFCSLLGNASCIHEQSSQSEHGSQPSPTKTTSLSTEPPHANTSHPTLSSTCINLGKAPTDPATALLIPSVTTPHGIDVSAAQGDVPWLSIKQAGVAFAFARVSEGIEIIDSRFKQNWQTMKNCNLPRGGYHVFDPQHDPVQQAEFFLGQLNEDLGELPPVLDIELPTKAPFPSCEEYEKAVLSWLSTVEARTGKRPLIYIQMWFWRDVLCKSEALKKYPLWVAGDLPTSEDAWSWVVQQHGSPVSWADRIWDRNLVNSSFKHPHLNPGS